MRAERLTRTAPSDGTPPTHRVQERVGGAETGRVTAGTPADGQAEQRQDVRVLLLLGGLGLGVSVLLAGINGRDAPLPLPLALAAPVAALAALVLLARRDRSRRRGAWWALAAVAAAHVLCGALATTTPALAQPLDYVERAVTLGGLYAAMIVLMRAQLATFHASTWLDGLIGVAGVAAAVATVSGPALSRATAAPLEVVTANLVLPVGALVVLLLVGGVFQMHGGRPGRLWRPLAGAVALLVLDGVLLVGKAVDDDAWDIAPTAAVDVLRGGLLLLLATVPLRERHRGESVDGMTGLRVLAFPALAALLSLGVLVASAYTDVAVTAQVLATASVVLALARVGLTVREVSTAADLRAELRTDELTGRGSRRAFLDDLDEAVRRHRDEGTPAAVLLCDLDRFKEVNDALGHHVGDGMLRRVGGLLADAVDDDGRLCRLGGDEFAVVLHDVSEARALQTGRRMRESLEAPLALPEATVHVRGSVGVALLPDDGRTRAEVLRRVDLAMYEAKRSRRGVYRYRPDLELSQAADLRLTQDLRDVLDRGGDGLVLHYQPQVALGGDSRHGPDGTVCGVEALVRWQHPERGLVPPGVFLPLARHAELQRRLTGVVLRTAVAQAARWARSGRALPVSVNLSPLDLVDASLPRQVARLLDAAGLDPSVLQVEVTEDTLLVDRDRACEVLHQLRGQGVRVALDDYGAGWSSLAYLRELPLHELKLDRAFVRHVDTDPVCRTIVRSTVDLAHSLGLGLVAEGAETAAAVDVLRAARCDAVQGYHYARPMPVPELEAWLDERPDRAGVPSPRTPAPTS